MRKTQIMGVLLIITVLLLGACGTTTTTLPPEPVTVTITPPALTVIITPLALTVTITPPALTVTIAPPAITITPTPTPTQGAYEVEEYDNFFSPPFITVPVGATITWTNLGYELHTVMSDTGLFDAELAPGDSFSYTFTEPGRYGYHCHYHINSMGGAVTVE